VRVLTVALCLPSLLAAQDAREIVRRACDIDRRNNELVRNYTYLQRQDESDLDSSGKVTKRQIRTWDITWQEGTPYRRLVRRNDQSISPEEQQAEDEKLHHDIDTRRKETPEQRQRRVAEWEKRQQRTREPLKELPDAFNFRIAGEEKLGGEETWVIDAAPKPGYKPKSSFTSYFPKVKARLWIGKRDFQWVKLDMETLDTVSLGWVLVRVGKGGHVLLEQTRVNDEVWLPKRVSVQIAARVLLFKGLRKNIELTFSDYKKFQAESRVVSTEVK
jgi:hypothetical protein